MKREVRAVAISCLLSRTELEGFAEPLCCTCKQDNRAVLVAGVWRVFSNADLESEALTPKGLCN